MEIYEAFTIGFIAVGIIFIILGFTFDRTKRRVDADEAAMEEDEFRKQVNLVNEKVLELNEYHEFMKSEMEKKHKELLFLYQMIGEKEKAIRDIQIELERMTMGKAIVESVEAETVITHEPDSVKRKIMELKAQGYNAKEIAKILGIGQGEVALVLNLFE